MDGKRIVLLVASVALLLITGRDVRAEESFWSRFNPFRNRDAETTQEERLENLRQRLTERGLDEAQIEERIARISEATATGETPSLDDLRERLVERGVDEAVIEDRIAQISAARESGNLGSGAPSLEELRGRMEEAELDSATIEDRLAKIADARANGGAGRTGMNFFGGDGEPSTDDLRARLEQRGLDAEQIEERLAKIESARENFTGSIPESGTGVAGGESQIPVDFEERMARFREMRAQRVGRQ